MAKTSAAAFAFALVWSTSATAIETPAASLYRALTDLCLDRYLSDKDLNAAQSNTGRPLIVHCDCMARFCFPLWTLKRFVSSRRAFQTILRRIGMTPLKDAQL